MKGLANSSGIGSVAAMPITDTPLRYPRQTQMTPLVQEIMRAKWPPAVHLLRALRWRSGHRLSLAVAGAIAEAWINDINRPSMHLGLCSQCTDDLCELIERIPGDDGGMARQRACSNGSGCSRLSPWLLFDPFLTEPTVPASSREASSAALNRRAIPLDCRFQSCDLVRKVRRIATYGPDPLSCQDARL